MMSTDESLAFLRSRMLGGTTCAVDLFPDPDLDGFVFTQRTPGKGPRSFSIIWTVGGLVVSELQPGCRVLTQVEDAKWRTALPGGDAA